VQGTILAAHGPSAETSGIVASGMPLTHVLGDTRHQEELCRLGAAAAVVQTIDPTEGDAPAKAATKYVTATFSAH